MVGLLRRIAKATVWAPGGIRPEDYRYRGIYRFVLPATDLLFLYFGIVGWHNGIRSVEQAAGEHWQTWWSLGIAASALVAFIGVTFPRLWVVEVCGKIPLVSLVGMYVALFLSRGVNDTKVTATAGLIMILILLPLWRISDLGFEAWQAKRARR